MKNLDLIVTQKKLEENRMNTLLEDKIKENCKRQREIKKIEVGIVIGLVLIYFIGMLIMFNSKEIEKARNNCLKNGYSMSYCLKNS